MSNSYSDTPAIGFIKMIYNWFQISILNIIQHYQTTGYAKWANHKKALPKSKSATQYVLSANILPEWRDEKQTHATIIC